jgi:aminoglycoside 2''-phosphotransferase
MRITPTKTLLSQIQQEFPRLRLNGVTRIPTGWDHIVLDVNKQIIFRFPRYLSTAKALQREIRLLSYLQNRLTVPIPDYKYTGRHHSLAGYTRISGIPLTTGGYRLNWTQILSRGLARFLKHLHSTRIGPRISKTIPTEGPRERSIILQKHHRRIKAHAYKYLDNKTRNLSEILLRNAAETLRTQNYKPVLIHGDLTDRNMLVEPTTGRLTGILDWNDARITDPAIDFCGLFEVNMHLGQQTLALYGERSRDFLERVEVYWRMIPYFDILYGAFSHNNKTRDNGIRRLRRRLEAKDLDKRQC